MRLMFVLWNGDVGGAERVTVALAGYLSELGVDTCVLFVRGPDHLSAQLHALGVPHDSLFLDRGAAVALHLSRLRRAITRRAPDVVVAVSVGYLGASVRAAGFRGPIIGIEHGSLLRIRDRRPAGQLVGWADRISGVMTYDAEVAVSQYMLAAVRARPHVRRIALIPHGVATDRAPPPIPTIAGRGVIVGFAGRLVAGKGVDQLLRAVAAVDTTQIGGLVSARIAGDGECRSRWEALARSLAIDNRVTFVGRVDDVAAHWARCHIAVSPTDTLLESFGMSAIEAMAAGRATIVTNRGGLPELVVPGATGHVVPAGSPGALAALLTRYAAEPERLHIEGTAAREHVIAHYSLRKCAERYIALSERLLLRSTRSPPSRARRLS